MNTHLPKIILIENPKPWFIHQIKELKNKKENWYSSRKNNTWNKICFHHNTFKMKFLLSPLNIHLLKITSRVNSTPTFLHLIKILINQKNNWYSSRENNKLNQTCYHQNPLKIKCLLSLLKLHLLKISLRPNSRPSLINMIRFLNNQKDNLWIQTTQVAKRLLLT